jgi:hypothetical protein
LKKLVLIKRLCSCDPPQRLSRLPGSSEDSLRQQSFEKPVFL